MRHFARRTAAAAGNFSAIAGTSSISVKRASAAAQDGHIGGEQGLAQFQHDGMEFIYMLSGKVIYRHADKLYPMGPGDALFFDAGAPHGPEELLEQPMTYLSIIIYPRP